MRSKSGKAFTLLEILIMGSLAVLLLGVFVKLCFSVSRGTHRSALEVSNQQTAALVVDDLVRNLKLSTSSQTLLAQNLLATRPLESISPEGRQSWSEFLEVFNYLPDHKELRKGRYRLQEGDLSKGHLSMTAATLLGATFPSKILARGVESFEIEKGETWTIRMVFRAESSARALTVERQVYLPMKRR